MMKKLSGIFVLLMLGASVCRVQAQDNYAYLSWDINVPLANTDWIKSTSASGGKAGYRVFFADGKFSAGFDFNWSTFDDYTSTETRQTGSGAITTDYFKYIYNYGITASGQYYFLKGSSDILYPYAGLGLGANYNNYTLYYNIYSDVNKSWGFLARPEAGILVRFGERRGIGAMAAVHADYSTSKSKDFGYDNFMAVGFQLGIVLMSR